MMQNNRKKSNIIIAITGGIGSGKSFALGVCETLGEKTISCDKITPLMYKKQSVLRKLKKIFPNEIKGRLFLTADKEAIKNTVFSDREKLKMLTDTLTPLIFKEVMFRAKKLKGVVFIEVPLLFEQGYDKYFDKIIVIMRNFDDRIKSVKTRSNLTEKEILERVNSQFDYENADFSTFGDKVSVMVNNGQGNLLSLMEQYIKKIK